MFEKRLLLGILFLAFLFPQPSMAETGAIDITSARYGAKAYDGSSSTIPDSSPAFDKAVTDACSTFIDPTNNAGHPPILIPKGTFYISRPVILYCNGVDLFGAAENLSAIKPMFNGPAILLAPASPPPYANLQIYSEGLPYLNLGSALVGSGKSMRTNGATHLNLRDMPQVELYRRRPNFQCRAKDFHNSLYGVHS